MLVRGFGNNKIKIGKENETTSIHHDLIVCVLVKADAQYYSVNYDKQTVAAMATAYGTEAVAEAYYNEQVQNILKHYNAAEVASAGIYASKFLERRAMTELGIWNSSTENYYYRRIYNMVSKKSCRRYGR